MTEVAIAPSARPLWVVKLGGSLLDSPLLNDWVRLLAAHGGRVVIVPGGGPFADAVRSEQQRWPFDDLAAHNMAVLAMAQYGHLLCGLEHGRHTLQPAGSVSAIADVLAAGQVAVWLPLDMQRQSADALTRWSVTSDSLAAWLAAQLGAPHLMLVKSCAIPAEASAAQLVAAGIVDAEFADYFARSKAALHVVSAHDLAPCHALLRQVGLNRADGRATDTAA